MLKPLIIVTGMVTLISGASLAQTTTPPSTTTPPGSGSRAIGPAPKSAEPVTPGTSTTPGTERPNDAQKSLESPSSGGSGGSGGGGSSK
jgi:hypothetical protein